jgi:hypothetical protein
MPAKPSKTVNETAKYTSIGSPAQTYETARLEFAARIPSETTAMKITVNTND